MADDVFDEFKEHFTPGVDAPASLLDDDFREQARSDLDDVRRFAGTKTYKELRKRLERHIEEARWQPGMTAGVSQSMLIYQTAMSDVLRTMDALVAMALEKVHGSR